MFLPVIKSDNSFETSVIFLNNILISLNSLQAELCDIYFKSPDNDHPVTDKKPAE